MKKILVTGATGFIGRAVCVKLLENGWKFKAVVRKDFNPSVLPTGIEKVYIESIENYNFCDKDFSEVEAVIHLAARVHMINDKAVAPLDAFRKVNVLGTKRLALAAAKAGVKRFIFLSSVKVNGETTVRPYTEKDKPDPQDAYGVSKKEAEDALADMAAETGMQIVIIRPPLVYGLGVKANFRSLIKITKAGIPLPFKNIYNKRSFVYLGNLADAIIICIDHIRAAGETFLISDGEDVSVAELINKIAIAMNRKPALFSFNQGILRSFCKVIGKSEELEKLAGSLLVDSSKMRNILGWTPPFSLEEGLKETVKPYKS
ncbi:MAG: SDR family oxidoreductase [PVC group bacterium]|nr:SDR family oxidoreductase [PVC group bacterium]